MKQITTPLLAQAEPFGHDTRGTARLVATFICEFEGAAVGAAIANVLRSNHVDGDRHGYVIQLLIRNDASCLTPASVELKDGLEIHFPGQCELLPLIDVLSKAQAYIRAEEKIPPFEGCRGCHV